MAVFDAVDFHEHENVVFGFDKKAGLKAIIAVHDTTLGPAVGGCRMFPYACDDDAVQDALRLSQGMSYKSALAHLPLGGGKSVIIADPQRDKGATLFRAMGRFINRMHGAYIAAQDSGISVADLQIMGEETDYVAGIHTAIDSRNRVRTGDPSPATAYGVFVGIKAAVKHQLNSSSLEGVKVAIQGVGNVGFGLAKHLYAEGVKLFVCDINPRNVQRAVDECGATSVNHQDIFGLDVDVFAPCALGGAINESTIDKFRAAIVAGSANNQLDKFEYGKVLQEKGILYAPDFVISAGGIIHVHFMRSGRTWEDATRHVEHIGGTLEEIFTRSRSENLPTAEIANKLAKERIQMGSSRSINSTNSTSNTR